MNEIQKPIFLMLVALTWSCFAKAELRYGRSCDAHIPFDIPVDRSMAEVSRLHFIAKFPRSSGDHAFKFKAYRRDTSPSSPGYQRKKRSNLINL